LQTYEYEDDEDSLGLFPRRKFTKCNQGDIDKPAFCKETCEQAKDELCAVWVDPRTKDTSKPHYTADGVFSYYKSFVFKLLSSMHADVSAFCDLSAFLLAA
jgi:hypothetical protein